MKNFQNFINVRSKSCLSNLKDNYTVDDMKNEQLMQNLKKHYIFSFFVTDCCGK